MIVDPDVLSRARRGQRDAIVEVLSAQYPSCYRMALGINGRPDVGQNIVRHVMKQSFRVVETWKDPVAPERWFRHHTLLTTRQAARWKPDAQSGDSLIREPDLNVAPYVAFVRAIRGLPHQQAEAFLLTHGEQLDIRSTAVGMDLSTTAATNHLVEAERRMKELAGDAFTDQVTRLRQAYIELAPTRDLALFVVARDARRYLWPRQLVRFIRAVLLLLVLAGVAIATIFWWDQIRRLVTSLLSRFGIS